MPGTDTTLPVFFQSRAHSPGGSSPLGADTQQQKARCFEPLLLCLQEPVAGFLHGVLRGCLVQPAASPPAASHYTPATAVTTEAQHGE